ncbi:MAG TPA: trypsin-like peptidase domain-containing protein [Pyrinomonadaceae bacterium]|nr:trypsin-like peptidase domain-containing protein [Pyrinomonadaceae bacterium]
MNSDNTRQVGIASLYCDTRLGGIPRYFLTDEPECRMYVPNEVRKSVVFIGYKKPDGAYQLAGTAFFVSRIQGANLYTGGTGMGFTYLVTAKHVIDGIRNKGADKVCMRVNFKDGEAYWLETDISKWLFHPTESGSVDVAVLRCGLAKELDHAGILIMAFATEDIVRTTNIGIGDEVFLVGLFANHHGTKKNIPLVRVGNIAAKPEEPVEVRTFGLMDAYLIEARSLGGISGSPVFVHIPAVRAKSILPESARKNIKPDDTVFFALGLMHGHWDMMYADQDAVIEDATGIQRVNMGIAIVVPASKILEVIEQPMIKENEERILKEEREKGLPTSDSLEPEQPITREGFEDALKRASRKISSPDEEKNET